MKIKINSGFIVCLGAIFLFNSYDYALIFISASLVHELGHLFFLALFKIKNPELILGITGAEIISDMSRLSYKKEALVYLGGALANFICALLCVVFLRQQFNVYVIFFFFANFFYAFINLLPIKSLDGGRTLECVLSLFLSPFEAFRWSFIVSQAFSVGTAALIIAFVVQGYSNITLLVLGVAILFQCIPSKPRCLSAS